MQNIQMVELMLSFGLAYIENIKVLNDIFYKR